MINLVLILNGYIIYILFNFINFKEKLSINIYIYIQKSYSKLSMISILQLVFICFQFANLKIRAPIDYQHLSDK